MKKLWALLIAALMTLSLAACGGSSDSASAATPAGEASEAAAAPSEEGGEAASSAGGSLKLALWDKNQEVAITPIVQEWGEANGIDVSVEVTPWDEYWTMLEASATGGAMPDVFWMHANQVRRYGQNGMLMELDERIAGSEKVDLSKFPEDIAGIYNVDGKQYGIPKDLDTIALWYNKTMFDEAGLSYPDDSWTWNDLKDAARALTKEDGSQYGFVCKASENQAGYWNLIYQNGGFVLSEDKTSAGWADAKTVEAMEFYTSFVEEGLSPDGITTAENEVYALLEAGTVAMGFQGSWMLGELGNNEYIIDNFDCTVLPAANDGTRVTIYNGLGWSAVAGTQNPDAAWALLEYLGSEEAQVKQGEATVCNISAHEAGQAAWGSSDERFNLQAYVDQVPNGVLYPSSVNTVVWDDMSKEKVGEMLKLARPAAEICEEMQTEMDAMLAEEG